MVLWSVIAMIKSGTSSLKQEFMKTSVTSHPYISNLRVNGIVGKRMKSLGIQLLKLVNRVQEFCT